MFEFDSKFYSPFADNGLKTRLEMIKNHAIAVLQELKVGIVSTHARYPSCLTVHP